MPEDSNPHNHYNDPHFLTCMFINWSVTYKDERTKVRMQLSASKDGMKNMSSMSPFEVIQEIWFFHFILCYYLENKTLLYFVYPQDI